MRWSSRVEATLLTLGTMGALVAPRLAPSGCLRAQGAPPPPAPRVVVLPFDFAAPVEPAAPRPMMRRPPAWPPMLPVAASATAAGTTAYAEVGAGVADLLVERLVAAGGLRVLERRHLDAVLAERARDSVARAERPGAAPPARTPSGGADYIVVGSIVGFGGEESRGLGGGGAGGVLGGLGFRRHTTRVALVARVVSSASGEVVLALRGEGVSHRGSGLTLGAIARGGGGVVLLGSSAFRESALGEATERAVADLAERLVAGRASLTPM